MLAPVRCASARVRTGYIRLGCLYCQFSEVKPDRRILGWLEAGSTASLSLNLDVVHGNEPGRLAQLA